MKKAMPTRTKNKKKLFWFVFSLLCLVTFTIHYFDLFVATKCSLSSCIESTTIPLHLTKNVTKNVTVQFSDEHSKLHNQSLQINTKQVPTHVLNSCVGRYIYVHDLPSRFNVDILHNCSVIPKWNTTKCRDLLNFGLGLEANNSDNILQNKGWYLTSQFSLEVIFHNRMKKYKCLTNDSSLASAIFVPFYAGLDVSRYLWDNTTSFEVKDSNSIELVKWLRGKREWERMQGKDHFFVVGRTSWDFKRDHSDIGWGNRLLDLSETRNMTILGIESARWPKNEFAIPYPTYFHPSKDSEVFEWQNKIRMRKRQFLYTFVGGPRPNNQQSIRGNIISQCLASKRKCNLVNCHFKNCWNPVFVMDMFQRSTFCLQPSGDSHTRRSTFDSIVAGCIPVFFHPRSAYDQYKWHLPMNYTTYSVFIPEEGLKNGTANIEKILEQLTEDEVKSMREEVIRMVPRVSYADPRASLETVEDAFDIAVERVIERVENIRKEMKGKRL